jgi:colanic acid/amylovoran biosynthesis glycosyltransferase
MRLAASEGLINVLGLPQPPITIAYLFTSFPVSTETFLQREIMAMQARGVNLRIYSLFGGGGDFNGIAVQKFSMWRLLELIWMIPWIAGTRWDVFGILWRGLWTRRPPNWLNFWENMLGAGFGGLFYREFRENPPDWIHAAWGGAPATGAWMLKKMNGQAFSAAAHAYDIYEHGGDWWLDEKLIEARFIHTSTAMGRNSLVERGNAPERVKLIRRGLESFPRLKPIRPDRRQLRIVAIARLVEKKGLPLQLEIYAAAQAAGINFTAHIIGAGPERSRLEARAAALGLTGRVSFKGHLSQLEVQAELAWADALLHTGIIAPSGDRDGLPNVIPEAMAAGVLVLTSPYAATTEAISDGASGWVLPVESPDRWIAAFGEIIADEVKVRTLQTAARKWAEVNFDAHHNAARLYALFEEAAKS